MEEEQQMHKEGSSGSNVLTLRKQAVKASWFNLSEAGKRLLQIYRESCK